MANAPEARHPYTFYTIAKLKTIYHEKKNRAPKSAWSKASDLIKQIIAPKDENAPAPQANEVKGPSSLEQDLMNIVFCRMALKPL